MTARAHNRGRFVALLARLLLLAISLLASFLLAEGLLRVIPLPGTGYRPTAIPGGRTSKRVGPDFRDRAVPEGKPAGVFRIVAIGDSITWGSGTHSEDAFPDRLERSLRHLPTTRTIEVLNFSRPGWSTEQEWEYSRYPLRTMAPDLLLIGFSLNDAELGPKARKRQLAAARRRRPRGRSMRWLVEHSVLADTLYERTENIRQKRAVHAYYQALYTDPDGWSHCVRSLESFRSFAVYHRIPLVLVVFPVFDGQIDASYPYRNLHQQIRDMGAEIGITVLDLLPTFEGMDIRRLAVNPFTDPHPNEIAHRIAADTIRDLLIRHNWLPLQEEAGTVTADQATPPLDRFPAAGQ